LPDDLNKKQDCQIFKISKFQFFNFFEKLISERFSAFKIKKVIVWTKLFTNRRKVNKTLIYFSDFLIEICD